MKKWFLWFFFTKLKLKWRETDEGRKKLLWVMVKIWEHFAYKKSPKYFRIKNQRNLAPSLSLNSEFQGASLSLLSCPGPGSVPAQSPMRSEESSDTPIGLGGYRPNQPRGQDNNTPPLPHTHVPYSTWSMVLLHSFYFSLLGITEEGDEHHTGAG